MSLEGVKEAGKLFETIFETEPNNPVVLSMYAWYFTAEANVGLRDWNIGKDMIETAKRAVKYGPDLSDANSLLAGLMAKNPKEFPEYSEDELFDAARKFAKKASDLNPKGIISILSAANSLNMNLFDGYGLNTQIRDFTSLFLATSILCFISFITRQYQWIFASGIIFLTITTLHIIVSLFYEAPISVTSLIAEIIFFVIAFVASYYFKFKDT